MNIKLYEDIASLEVDIKEKEDFNNRLQKQRNDLENEVKYLKEKVELKNEDIIKMESVANKEMEVRNDVFKALENENVELKLFLESEVRKMDEMESEGKKQLLKNGMKEKELIDEIKILEEEVENLQEINKSKEAALKQIEEEKNNLDNEIEVLKGEIKVETSKNTEMFGVGTVKSLKDELEDFSKCDNLLTAFECRTCSNEFPSKLDLRNHIKSVHVNEEKLKLRNLDKSVENKTENLVASINVLVRQEMSKLKEPCTCHRFCNINHMKHNWTKICSTDIVTRFGEIKNGGRESGEVHCV